VTDPAVAALEPLRFERSYETSGDYPARFARAYFRFTFSQPRRFVPLLVIFALFFMAILIGNPTIGAFLFPLGYLAILVILYGFLYAATVRQMRRRIPAGSIFGVGFRSSTFLVRSPQVTSEVAYSLYRSCERRGRFVVLRQRVSRVSSFLPAEIFTEESFEFLRARIGLFAPTP
jgi:hypothetical protein